MNDESLTQVVEATPNPAEVPADAAIEAVGLTRYFERRCVVDRLDFSVSRGRVTALLGLNGVGKTTTLRMMMGLLAPTRGRCTTLGVDARLLGPDELQRIGYLVEGHYLVPWMRVREVGRFAASGRPNWNQSRFGDVVAHFAVDPNQRVGQISRGQRAGVSLAAILAADPQLLVLDDPALGLDPISRRALNETLVEFAAQTTLGGQPRTVLLSTHLLDDVERIADEIAVMIGGRLLIHASLSDFQSRVSRYAFELDQAADRTELLSKLSMQIPGLVECRCLGDRCQVCLADAGQASLERLAELARGDVLPLTASLDDLVVAYLSRQRSEHSLMR